VKHIGGLPLKLRNDLDKISSTLDTGLFNNSDMIVFVEKWRYTGMFVGRCLWVSVSGLTVCTDTIQCAFLCVLFLK